MSKFISQLGAYNEGYADSAASRDAEIATLSEESTNLRTQLYQEREVHGTYVRRLKEIASEHLSKERAKNDQLREQVNELNRRLARNARMLDENDQLQEQVTRLLFAVIRKFPNESRFETALRYIREAELNANEALAATEPKP